ncbi:MAG: carbon-nitrogen hydrolase family protein [Planctomycetes bacterium]|jgi:predicted amidohydrolase|nr:carbon-nitrogen hydrolase family protein [Planctomycetota bacterium]
MAKFKVASVQFAETYNPLHNARRICRFISAAAVQGAQVAHFHECALSGYLAHPKSPSLDHVDFDAVRTALGMVRRSAREAGMWVVVGSAHALTPPHRPHNSLYLISPDGKIADRYDKRFLTPADLKVFTPGDHDVIFSIGQVRCALLICYEVRFPEVYRRLASKGVEMVFQSFHNAYVSGPGIHDKIMRQTMQAHAGMNYFWASAVNSAGRYSSYPSIFVTPDGAIAASLPRNKSGMMLNEVDTSLKFYDASGPFRRSAIAGAMHNGRCLKDPRSDDRRGV